MQICAVFFLYFLFIVFSCYLSIYLNTEYFICIFNIAKFVFLFRLAIVFLCTAQLSLIIVCSCCLSGLFYISGHVQLCGFIYAYSQGNLFSHNLAKSLCYNHLAVK